ncbi:LysR substrate-binding domain-containing protein [Rhizobium sp. S163]|uniref:LysR family transcriptional regulator n=1 Tax=Rhizobium sp. S163 TaxID=3055039 RepID=UPI0025A93B5A|nr:LysR substrate-binding domain-containing protein [Rhizobium sp. S163]MDM9646442.1 LysR substrate-binding domain-containing protein [Rhizobium sp. S163]
MDLLGLADFILVARHGGFGKAERATGRPKATLSRRVAELEASLGLRLVERGARMLKLTEEGRALHQRAGALLTELDETASAIAAGGDKPRGRLRISAPMLFSQTAMGKLAASFALKYPEVRLEVTTEDRLVDMIEEGYDLVIRVDPDPDKSLVGRVFLRDRLVLVAPAGMAHPKDGAVVPAIVRGSLASTKTWAITTDTGSITSIHIEPILSLSSLLNVRDAVRMGIGAALLPISLVGQDIALNKVAKWGEVKGSEIGLWALHPSRRLLSARVSAFLDHLKSAFPNGKPDELSAYIDG